MISRRTLLFALLCMLAPLIWAERAGAETEKSARRGDHWSFRSPGRPELPPCDATRTARGAIDAFVLARLESEGLKASPEADRSTLIRRLSLDLTGLPPGPGEVDRFLADESPDAYERLVDRLLASPHFGERWGRHWLDLARYADTDGYTLDGPRPWAWRWRDWVIDAINFDLPFDRFTIEQLAGDLLPDGNLDTRIATGFHRNTLRNFEGGVDQEEYRNRAVVDRVNTTGAVWLGLTLGCAQCHDHKYDPLSQQEFYELFAFFNNDDEPDVPAPLPLETLRFEEEHAAFDVQGFEAETKRLEAAIAEARSRLSAKVRAWEKTVRAPVTRWTVLVPKSLGAVSSSTRLEPQPDGSVLVTGGGVFFNNFSLSYEIALQGVTALRIEVLPDSSQPGGGPGRHDTGNYFLSQVRVATASKDQAARGEDPTPVVLSRALADFEEPGHEVSNTLDGDTDTGWSIGPSFGRHHTVVYLPEKPFGDPGGSVLTVGIDHLLHTIGRFRVLATSDPLEAVRRADALSESDALPYSVVEVLRKDSGARDSEDTALLAKFVETIDPELRVLKAARREVDKSVPKAPATRAQTLALREKDARKTHIHVRGDFLRKGDEVFAGTPSVLPAIAKRGDRPDRLDLAHWIVNPANPLSPRVFANRVWQRLFGKGLVLTTDDFGTRGELPSHPELLDWLARDAVRSGWSRKALVRRIVLSRTYRQSSRQSFDLVERDPENRLLARQNRYRLEAEILRDVGLAVSGQMTWRLGGPSVRPPLPGKVGDIGFANLVPWVVSEGEDAFRRGLYIFIQRIVPYPMLSTFDAPESTVTCAEREISNTPLHALFLLNDQVFLEFARQMARRVLHEASEEVSTRLRYAFRLSVGREPEVGRLAVLQQLHTDLLVQFDLNPDAARKFSGAERGATQLAAWTAICRVLMNTDRYLTRE